MNLKVYERAEFKFENKVLSAAIINKNGETISIEPFVYQPIEFLYNDEGVEKILNNGEPFDMVRFTLKEEGKYVFEAKLENGDVFLEEIEVKGFFNDGFVKVSEKDNCYFSYSNGKSYFPIAVNVCFPRQIPVSNDSEFGVKDEVCYMGLKQYERWFKKLSQNGVDLVRLWLGHPYFTPDTLDAKIFDYSQFSKIDAVIELAKKYGLRLKLTLEQFRYTDNVNKGLQPSLSHLFNKPMKIKGKYCSSIEEWMTKEKWKNAWLSKVAEFSKRYAGDTQIFAIELWNEMNCLPNVNEWNLEMLPKVKALFPDNMVINSLGSLDCEKAVADYNSFPWELSAFKQIHRYLDQGAKLVDAKNNPIEMVLKSKDYLKNDKQPIILAETGAVNNCHSGENKYYSVDDRGIFFVDCVYTPVFCGMASIGNIWHWDQRYIESKNLYKFFNPISKLTKDIDFANESFISYDLSDDDVYLFILKGNTVSLGFIRNKYDNWQNVLRDMNEIPSVLQKQVDFACENVEQIKIWNEDTTNISVENGRIIFNDIIYGTLFVLR